MSNENTKKSTRGNFSGENPCEYCLILYISTVKYILFVIFPLAIVFGSFLEVIKTTRATEGLKQWAIWENAININYDHFPSNIYRKGRDGL